MARPKPPTGLPSSTRGRDTDTVVCQDTTTSREASAPNCRCNPDTGGAPSDPGRCHSSGAAEAVPGAPSSTAPPTPAPTVNRPRLLIRSASASLMDADAQPGT